MFPIVENSKAYFESQQYTNLWVTNKLSNYDYLCLLNKYSSRSYNDINQYPIFPWVIKNYSKDELDINDDSIFRDFSNPMAVQNDKKKESIKNKYNENDSKFKFHFCN